MRDFLLFSILLLLSACVSSENPAPKDQTLGEAYQEALDKIDVEACTAGGGEVRRAGILGLPRCITPYADAGNSCKSGEQCAGRCMAADDITDFDAPPGDAKGICENNDSPFGCYATIDNGTISPFICVD